MSATLQGTQAARTRANRAAAMDDQLLQSATIAMEAGRREEARRLLEDVVLAAPRSELGWLWLAEVVDTDEERRFCLAHVLSINHRNALARRSLEVLGPWPSWSPLLQRVAAIIEEGRVEDARHLIEEAVQANPCSERSWLWLAKVVDSDEERRFCLNMVLSINHRNALARRELETLGLGPTRSPLDGQDEQTVQKALSELRAGQLPLVPTERLQTQEPDACDTLSEPPIWIALGYLGALTTAEVFTVFFAPRVGLLLHSILLVILLFHTALAWERPTHRLLLSLAFAPLIRLLSLSLPLSGIPLVYWYFVVSVPLFAAAFVALRTLGFSRSGMGLNLNALPLQVLVTLTGLSLGYIEYRILQPSPMIPSLTWEELWLPGLILIICTGLAEELIFRGMMQQTATETLGRGWGIFYVAALFAVLHVGYQSVIDVVFVFGVALFFGLTRAHTGSIVGVSLAHGMTNVLLFLTMPLGVNHFDIIASYLCRR